jgi:ribosome-associated heat shock protein Hsp15
MADAVGARIDVWVWAVRLYPTRSVAADACRAGHVKVNDVRVKPSQVVKIGDVVRAYTPGGERIVVVSGLLSKRVGAAMAVQHYEDRTPPKPPKEERDVFAIRERGAGRPTKRDRRLTQRLRGR